MTLQAYQVGGRGELTVQPEARVFARAPTVTDIVNTDGTPYRIGQLWFDNASTEFYIYAGGGNWLEITT